MIDFLKYRYIYFIISLGIIVPGTFSLVTHGLKPSVDFTGGTVANYLFSFPVTAGQIEKALADSGFYPREVRQSQNSFVIKLPPLTQSESLLLSNTVKKIDSQVAEIAFENVGPILGKELVKKTLAGLLLASSLILLYLAIAFKNLKFGVCATLATLHDTLVILGIFSLLGWLFDIEVDSLFVTALLTVLSFSVHDTIVVFDRIRESQKSNRYLPFEAIINKALNQTMVRSLNNSLTIIFMLIALLLLGGETIRWFVLALLIGTVSGTYSSPFVATPLLLLWDKLFKSKLD